MRKAFAVVLVCLVLGGAGLFALSRNGAALDAESRGFVQDAVVTIAGHWDADELWTRSTAHFREATKRDDLRALFEAANGALGRMLEAGAAQGQATISLTPEGTIVTALYAVKANFERGDAEIKIGAVKTGDSWRIEGFNIGSSLLMRRLVGLRS